VVTTSDDRAAAARERWTAFLDKVEAHVRDLLARAAPALPLLVDLKQFDTTPFANALTAVRLQAGEAIRRIETTWSQKASATLLEALEGEPDAPAQLEAELQRGEERRWQLERLLREAEVNIAAEAARKLLAEAQRVLAQRFACSQCQAALPLRQQFFRSYYVTCSYCNTVNTFEPGLTARMVEHFAVHALAEAGAQPEYFRHLDAEQRKNARPLAERIAAYRTYVDKYLEARLSYLPEDRANLDVDRQAKLDAYLKTAAR
jgi:hypothetical protein